MWRELSKIRRPTEGDEYGDEYQKILIFIAQPRELSFTSEKMLRFKYASSNFSLYLYHMELHFLLRTKLWLFTQKASIYMIFIMHLREL